MLTELMTIMKKRMTAARRCLAAMAIVERAKITTPGRLPTTVTVRMSTSSVTPDLGRRARAKRVEGVALLNLGLVARTLGRFEEAKRRYLAAGEALRVAGDRKARAAALDQLASTLGSQGRQRAAMHPRTGHGSRLK